MTTERQRLAWITGAGKGIGRAVALNLADQGWHVAASARTQSDLDKLIKDGPDGRITAFPLDVTDLEATRLTLDAIEEQLSLPDLVILNAGTHIPTPAQDFSIKSVQTLMNTNVIGTANGLSQIMPRFISRRRGQIAVVASLAGYRGLPTAAAYGASKAALINMCEALKPELEQHNVNITLVNPGFVKTPLTARNEFPMPFLIEADKAADCIVRRLNAGAFEIAFPSRFAWLMRMLRILPDGLFFALTRRMIGT